MTLAHNENAPRTNGKTAAARKPQRRTHETRASQGAATFSDPLASVKALERLQAALRNEAQRAIEAGDIERAQEATVAADSVAARLDEASDARAIHKLVPGVLEPGEMCWPDMSNGRAARNSQANVGYFLAQKQSRFALNKSTGRYEIREGQGPWRPLVEQDLRTLRLEADRLGLKVSREKFEDICFDLAHKASRHPVRSYLANLPWDGVSRLELALSTYFGAADTPLTRAFSRSFFIACVRRVRKPGCKFDQLLVLEGAQGTNKSTALRLLAGDEHFTDCLSIGAEAREIIEQTSGAWIVEIAELAGIRKADIEDLKAMLSRQSDRARAAYGRIAEDRPRQWIAVGTVNGNDYLRVHHG